MKTRYNQKEQKSLDPEEDSLLTFPFSKGQHDASTLTKSSPSSTPSHTADPINQELQSQKTYVKSLASHGNPKFQP